MLKIPQNFKNRKQKPLPNENRGKKTDQFVESGAWNCLEALIIIYGVT